MNTAIRLIDHSAVRLAGPLAGLCCAAIFLATLDAPAVGAAFSRVAWWWLAPMLVLGCVNLWLRAIRWGVLLAPAAPLPTAQLLRVGLAAALAGLGLPARGGDLVKMLLAARLPGVKLADVAAAELLERLVDGAIFGAFIAGAAVLGGVAGWPLFLGLGTLGIYLPILAAVPIAGWYLGAPFERACEQRARGWHPRRLIGWAADAAYRRGPSLLAHAARLSLLAWAAEAAVGTFHLPISSLLVDSFGAEPSLASAFAVALHVGVLAPVPLLWALLTARSRLQAAPIRAR